MATAVAAATEAAALEREIALFGDESEIRTILEWSGFITALQRERIVNESFQDYIDTRSLTERT